MAEGNEESVVAEGKQIWEAAEYEAALAHLEQLQQQVNLTQWSAQSHKMLTNHSARCSSIDDSIARVSPYEASFKPSANVCRY